MLTSANAGTFIRVPNAQAHLDAVRENDYAYKGIPEEFPGWKAVVLFYMAVHLMEALFAIKGLHHQEHSSRERYIKQHHSSIWNEYSFLKSESQKARYLALSKGFDPGKIARTQFALSSAQVHEQIYKKKLKKIWNHVKERMPAKTKMPELSNI